MAKQKDIPVEWKFNPKYEDLFLDIWFEKEPNVYNSLALVFDSMGSDMIHGLFKDNRYLFDEIHTEVMSELGQAGVDLSES